MKDNIKSLEDFAGHLEEWVKVLKLSDENPFKIRAFEKATQTILDKATKDNCLHQAPKAIKGWPAVGDGIAKLYQDYLTGQSAIDLTVFIKSLPEGLIEISEVSGLGPKRARQVVSELGVDSLSTLLHACREKKLARLKGFGEKLNDSILKQVTFMLSTRGSVGLGAVVAWMDKASIKAKELGYELYSIGESTEVSETYSALHVGLVGENHLIPDARTLGGELGCAVHVKLLPEPPVKDVKGFTALEQSVSVRGVFHSHTTESDGRNTLQEMVEASQALGLDYLGVSDHSQTSFYANGLKPERVMGQAADIQSLNCSVQNFRIFSGIESDILADGSLDYTAAELETFDFVIASIHQRYSHDKVKMTDRLIAAVSNPYTTFLGHWSGRLVLGRLPYDFDREAVLKACAKHGVILELNCNQSRLDPIQKELRLAKKLGIMISLNPDAHSTEELEDLRLGKILAQAVGYPHELIFNTKSLTEVEDYFALRKRHRA